MKKNLLKLLVFALLGTGCASNDPWNGTHWNGVHKSMTCDRMLPVWRSGMCPDCLSENFNTTGLVAQR